jgi:hypothetical protein
MRQPHSSACHCGSVMVSSHADTASRSIELNDSDSVAIASDTLSSCRHTLTSSHGQRTVHTATRVMPSFHTARNSDGVVVSSHAHTKYHSTSSSCWNHTAPLATATVSWCCHTQTPPIENQAQRQRLRRHRQRHAVIVPSHTDVVSRTRDLPHIDSRHAQLPCRTRW